MGTGKAVGRRVARGKWAGVWGCGTVCSPFHTGPFLFFARKRDGNASKRIIFTSMRNVGQNKRIMRPGMRVIRARLRIIFWSMGHVIMGRRNSGAGRATILP